MGKKHYIKWVLATSVWMCLLACENKPQQNRVEIDYKEIVKTLSTNGARVAYLQGIQSLDEEVRKKERTAVSTYGWDSPEHKAAVKAIAEADATNLTKVEAFLQILGYPDKQTLKSNATDAPYTVLLHSKDVNVKERNFKYVYAAYRNKDLPGGSLAFYLHSLYELKTGEKMTIPNPFQESFELDTLIRSLKLDTTDLVH